MFSKLTPEKALIFRITHRDNMPWIIHHGLHCRNARVVDPNYIEIGNPDLIVDRKPHPVPRPPGGTLSDYVPFYFTPYSPMLYNIKTGWGGIHKRGNDEIVILITSLHKLRERGVPFLFTDRHAYLAAAQFYSDMARLDKIDWSILQKRDFKRDPINDPGKVERYQAEALVHERLPIDALLGITCYNQAVETNLKMHLARRGLNVETFVRPNWYF